MCLREELSHAEKNVKIVEIFPPPVQSELHDKTMGKERGRAFGMPADEFVNQTYEKLIAGEDQIIIGSIVGSDPKLFQTVFDGRMTLFQNLAKLLWSHH